MRYPIQKDGLATHEVSHPEEASSTSKTLSIQKR